MGRTFEALKKAEDEKRVGSEVISIASGPSEVISIASESRNLTIPFQMAQEYYRLKQSILRNNFGEKIKTLLFSGSTGGEGNSTVIIDFAIMLSCGGERVLLVDANLRDPFFHKIFNLERENGLTDLFLGKSTFKQVIKKTQINNLSTITSGTLHSNPFIILESNSLDSHIAEMKAEADWVLFDSPPINLFNDSIALASKVDGVIMVVEAEKTRWEVAQSAKQRIESANGRILGVILNKRRFYVPEWLYKTL